MSVEKRDSSTRDRISILVLLLAIVAGIATSVVYAFDLGPDWLFLALGWSVAGLTIAVGAVFAVEALRTGTSWLGAAWRGVRDAADFVLTWLP